MAKLVEYEFKIHTEFGIFNLIVNATPTRKIKFIDNLEEFNKK